MTCWAARDTTPAPDDDDEILLRRRDRMTSDDGIGGWMDAAAWEEYWSPSQPSRQIDHDRKLASSIQAAEEFRASLAGRQLLQSRKVQVANDEALARVLQQPLRPPVCARGGDERRPAKPRPSERVTSYPARSTATQLADIATTDDVQVGELQLTII